MPIDKTISIDIAIHRLNSMLAYDPDCMHDLVEHRVPCNEDMVRHESAQVYPINELGDKGLGVLGVINGLFGADEEGWGPIAAYFDEGKLQEFRRAKKAKVG